MQRVRVGTCTLQATPASKLFKECFYYGRTEIVENLGSLGENARGWSKEVNLISWNEKEPKYDIRDWAPDHSRMGKGVTLTADELAALKDLLAGIDLDSFE